MGTQLQYAVLHSESMLQRSLVRESSSSCNSWWQSSLLLLFADGGALLHFNSPVRTAIKPFKNIVNCLFPEKSDGQGRGEGLH